MYNITNIYKKYGLLLVACASISGLVAVCTNAYLKTDFNIQNQSATVALAQSSCFTEGEMTSIQSEKKSIEDSLYDQNTKLEAVETEIAQVSKEYKDISDEIETLRRNVVTEDILNKIKTNIDTLHNKLLTFNSDTVDSNTGVCSTPGYFDKNSCENASGPVGGSCTVPWNTDERSCVTDGYFEGGGCSASGYYDKASCENAGYSYSVITGRPTTGTCSGGDSYTDESSCVNAGYYTDSGCSDSAYYDKYSCVNAGYYQDDGTFVSNGNTWIDSTFVLSGYSWSQSFIEELTEVTIPFGYTWKEPQWVNAGYSWTYSSYAPYGYRWIEASERETKENVEASIESLSKEYTDKLTLRGEQMREISTKESNLSSLHATLKEVAGEKILIKENIVKLESRIRDIESRASKGLCQAFELSCGDSLDNDNDTKIDCSDSDCLLDSYCSNTTTGTTIGSSTEPSATTTPGTTGPAPVSSKPPVPSKPPFSSKFNGTFSTVVSLTNNILTVNSRDIVPAMKNIKVQSSASTTDPQTLLSRISTVKAMVNSNIDTIAKLKTALTQLQTENIQTGDIALKTETAKLVSAGNLLVDSLNSYHTTLLKFLTGTVPTSDLDVELNQRIADATAKGNSYRSLVTSTNTVLTAATKKAEAQALTQSSSSSGTIRASAITPRPGEVDVSVSIDKITVTFAQDIVAFNKATVVVKDSFGDTLRTVEMMGAKNTFVVEFIDPLKSGNIYTVSISGIFIQETTLSEQTWNQTWSFATEKKESLIGSIIDFIDDLLGLGNTSPTTEVCDDGKDNDNNGVADCSDKACEDHASCKKPVCGNRQVEEGEGCDDGNDISGDGCTNCHIDEQSDTCNDSDSDGYDDSDASKKCGCLDANADGKDDVDGTSCTGDEGGKTCLICQYEIDHIEGFENRFKNRCESRTATKKIIQKDSIYGDEVSQCPKNTTRYDFEIAGHSCAANFARLSGAMKKSLTTIRNNIYSLSPAERSAFESKTISINGLDNGCHSAGGLFSIGNNWYNSFNSFVKSVENQFFLNNVVVNLVGNQTYGYSGNDKTYTTNGRVKLSSFVQGSTRDVVTGEPSPGSADEIKVQYSTCPFEGEPCGAPVNNPHLIQERIVCGEVSKPRNFYCATDYRDDDSYTLYNGEWEEEK